MPSIVHSSPSLTGLPGLALVSHDFSEQADGMLTVNAEFVCRASKQFEIDRLFAPDAPPPVVIPGINLSHLLYNRLFMSGRSISQSNGLVMVKAQYAGGLVRGGEYMIFYKETESPVTFSYVSEPYTISRQDPNNPSSVTTAGNLTTSFSFTYVPITFIYEYTKVGEERTGNPGAPGISGMYNLIQADGGFFDLGSNQDVVFRSFSEGYYRNSIEGRGIVESISESVVTPLVRRVTHRFALA